MPLQALGAQLDTELDAFSTHFRDFAATKPPLDSPGHFSFLDECLLEGLLSRVWQSWCGFCRNCLIESCGGTTSANGAMIPALPDALTPEHVSGAAIQAKKGRRPYWGVPNTTLRNEPTWGDVDVLIDVITRLAPANATQMLAAFSAGHSHAKALQLIRNGTAHNHFQNLQEIKSLQPDYLVFPILHPTHALFWVDPASMDFLVTHSIEGLRSAGSAAIG